MNIIKSSTLMRKKNSTTSPVETECLFGESVEILDKDLDWVFCKLLTDDYCGWIRKDSLEKFEETTHRVIVKRSFVYEDKNAKSDVLMYLPMGAKLAIKEIKSDWSKVSVIINDKKCLGYVPVKHIVNNEHKCIDWVAKAQLLEGTPYRWGGRDTIGIDCSALLQLSYQTYGQIIPRNTSDQINLEKKIVNKINELKRGCVVFWEGHVGIMIDRFNCIHANAYHMKTVTEPLIDIINRMDKYHQIVKMMDFNG